MNVMINGQEYLPDETSAIIHQQYAKEDHTKIYSAYRKDTPTEVIEKIVSFLKEKLPEPLDTAVDVGCGSGQGTVTLAPFFQRVYGFDISEAQIGLAKATRSLPNVTYEVRPVERLPFADGSVQLLTAGTALHWFDLDTFFPEARRVLCPNGVMAVYMYHNMKPLFKDHQKNAEFDEIYEKYNKTEKSYAMTSRVKMVVNEYKDITFPFEEVIRCPYIRCYSEGKLSDLVNYASTFSGFQNFLKVDREAAEECLDSFRNRLYEIGASCNYSAEDAVTLYRDYRLILCRKTTEGPSHPEKMKSQNFTINAMSSL